MVQVKRDPFKEQHVKGCIILDTVYEFAMDQIREFCQGEDNEFDPPIIETRKGTSGKSYIVIWCLKDGLHDRIMEYMHETTPFRMARVVHPFVNDSCPYNFPFQAPQKKTVKPRRIHTLRQPMPYRVREPLIPQEACDLF